ncbi:TadG family pilus assembly protein [Methylobacterium radiodurans]|uniref:TadG family pilus assembly protein n=1 Tax=Methylobacterium radiodurans TaxID=2202828 RepID=UPI0013A55DEC|nr:TadG family pilus assembly protein [Methylobacterium radiodurans]
MRAVDPGRARAFRDDRGGGVVLIAAVLIVILTQVAGLVVDVGMAYREKNILLTSAEAAALAVGPYISSADGSAALPVAQSYAARNRPNVGDLVTAAQVEFGQWSKGTFTPGGPANAVRVTASRTAAKKNALETSFAKLFGIRTWDVSASAVAVAGTAPVCILTLHPDHFDAFDIDRGARIDAPDCHVHVNSKHSASLGLGSSSYVNVKSIHVVGGVDRSGSATVNPAPVTGADVMADPYAALPAPVNNACGGRKLVSNADTTLTPTQAFCDGLTIAGGTVTFSPGVYVIKGPLTVKDGASIRGSDVLIYLDGSGSDIFFHSNTSFNLKAAATGPYAGIVLWSDKRNTHDHDIYSKFGAVAEGTIYAPSSQVEFENNVVWEASCIRIVVSRLELDNNSRYQATKPDANCSNNLYQPGGVRLVR